MLHRHGALRFQLGCQLNRKSSYVITTLKDARKGVNKQLIFVSAASVSHTKMEFKSNIFEIQMTLKKNVFLCAANFN
jgi:hypothetical protein